jgi:ubiquinone/menaquinone biosynthesis C-methylase UbiE
MSFDRLAPYYTWMEIILAGKRLQHCRVAWLDALAGCNEILIAGVGHGHFLAACARRFPRARITSVDASLVMLHHAAQRARNSGAQMQHLGFVHAALPDWIPPPRAFDAIVTHFFLDCFAPRELDGVVGSLADSARRGAVWLLSDFAVPPRGLARHRARAVHALMYAFFRRITKVRARRVTDPAPLLVANGFELAGRKSAEWGLLRADRWERKDGPNEGHGMPKWHALSSA